MLRIEVFTKKSEAQARFKEFVVEQELADGKSDKEAQAIAAFEIAAFKTRSPWSNLTSGWCLNYTSEGGCGDHDIIVVELD